MYSDRMEFNYKPTCKGRGWERQTSSLGWSMNDLYCAIAPFSPVFVCVCVLVVCLSTNGKRASQVRLHKPKYCCMINFNV